ncbi:MAG: phage tail length tape measure family protein [Bacteroidota bacterium]
MSKDYTFRVSGVGVEQLRRDLDSLGPAGKKAFDLLAQAAPALASPLNAAGDAADKLRQRLDRLAEKQAAAARTSINQQAKARDAEQWEAMLVSEAKAAELAAAADAKVASARASIALQAKARQAEQWEAMLAAEARSAEDAARALAQRQQSAQQMIATYAPAIVQAKRLDDAHKQLDQDLKDGLITQDHHAVAIREVIRQQKEMGDVSGHSAGQVRQAQGIITSNLLNIGNVAIATKGNLASMVTPLPDVIYGLRMAGGATLAWGLGLVGLAASLALTVGRAASLNSELRQMAANQVAFNNRTFSPDQAQATAHAMADNSPWFSRSDADKAIAELNRFRTVSAETMRDIQSIAADFAKASGQELDAGAKNLAESFAKGYAGIKALNEVYGFLDAAQMARIRRLSEEGRHTDAARIALEALTRQMREAADLSKGAASEGFQEMAAAWNKALDGMANSPAMKSVMEFLAWYGRGIEQLTTQVTEYDAAQKRLAAARNNLDDAKKGGWSATYGLRTDSRLRDAQAEYDAAVAEMDRQVEAARAQAEKTRAGAKEQDAAAAAQAQTADKIAADELTKSYGKQTAALLSNADARERLEIVNAANEKFRDKPNSDLEKRAFIEGELAKKQAERLGTSREAIRVSEAEAAAADRTATAFSKSAEAGYAEQISAQAGVVSLTKRIPLERALAEVKADVAKQVAVQLSAQAQAQAGYGREEDALRQVAAAALVSADAEHDAAEAAQVAAKYADTLAKARASGSAEAVAAVKRQMDTDQAHLAVLRSINAVAEANRQLRQGKNDISLSQREIELMRAGIKPEDRDSILRFERDRLRIREQVADIQDEGEKKRKQSELEDQAADLVRLDREKAFYTKVERWAESSAENITEFMVDALEESGNTGGKRMLEAIRKTFLHAVISLPMTALVTPILTQGISYAGSAIAGAFGYGGGSVPAVAGGAVGGGAAAAGGGSSDMLGAASLGYRLGSQGSSSGLTNSINAWGASNLGLASGAVPSAITTSGEVVAYAGTMTAADGTVMAVTTSGEVVPISGTMAGGSEGSLGGTTLSDALGYAGAAYNLYSAWSTGSGAQKALTTVGAAIGGAFGGPAGAAIGSTIGNLVGGLFPKSKKAPTVAAQIGYETSADGVIGAGNAASFGPVLGRSEYNYWQTDQPMPGWVNGWAWATNDVAAGTAKPVIDTRTAMAKEIGALGYRYGADLAGQSFVSIAQDGKMSVAGRYADNRKDQYTTETDRWGNNFSRFYYDPSKDGEAETALARFQVSMLARANSVANADVQTAARSIAGGGYKQDAAEINKLLSFAENFDDALAVMSGGIADFSEAVGTQTRKKVLDTTNQIIEFIDQTKTLGLDVPAATAATKEYVKVLLGVKDVAKPLSDVEKALQALDATYANIQPLLDLAGITDTPAALKAQAKANLTRGFNESLADMISAITDPASLARKAENERYAQQLEDAKKLGADLQNVEELHRLKMLEINKQANASTVSAIQSQYQGLQDWLNQQTLGNTSSLTTQQKLAEAQSQFGSTLTAARGGDTEAIQRVTRLADSVLSLGGNALGSGVDYAALESWVRSSVSSLGHDLGLPGFAGGTSSAPPGLAWVGERGRELVRFRGGEQVFTAGQSEVLARSFGGTDGGAAVSELRMIQRGQQLQTAALVENIARLEGQIEALRSDLALDRSAQRLVS